MSARILVAYVSPKGSTAEIAEAIGKELKSAGYSIDIAEMKAVSSVEGYNAVVMGAPLYMGKVVGDMAKFIRKHLDDLEKIPVAAFTVGMSPVDKNPASMEKATEIFHRALDPLKPAAETIFAGKVDPEKLSFMQRWMIGKAQAPVGDFRDWDAIATWAKELPGKLGI
ncbi:menaquinone-dependent protoporphyrinogen oxidase [Methanolinea mesophila]|uniref:flavodoxin domain-containing protein n=1 Tax=Methanolinea mesophila TaxID=547055 RepID=UPI001AE13AB7|nr:flavodoxin domain-containing protein [Methanolinea mesophila]MBP1929952.1 menaquinone-dependent protoporphyrinogen oxidase [Methanolinea mesophila]